jgi:hypothetical protein
MLKVNAIIELGNRNQGSSMGAILSEKVNDFYVSNKDPNRFQMMNRLGADFDNKYHVDFLGDTKNLDELKKSVNNFLMQIENDFNDPATIEDLEAVLQEIDDDYNFPEFKKFTIL